MTPTAARAGGGLAKTAAGKGGPIGPRGRSAGLLAVAHGLAGLAATTARKAGPAAPDRSRAPYRNESRPNSPSLPAAPIAGAAQPWTWARFALADRHAQRHAWPVVRQAHAQRPWWWAGRYSGRPGRERNGATPTWRVPGPMPPDKVKYTLTSQPTGYGHQHRGPGRPDHRPGCRRVHRWPVCALPGRASPSLLRCPDPS